MPRGFTILELLIVVAVIGLIFSVALPVSFNMYRSYKASLAAQEVMAFVSGVRREAFLYSEKKILSAQSDAMIVGGVAKPYAGIRVRMESPIAFYANGTSSGGLIVLDVEGDIYRIHIQAPRGDISLMKG